MEDILYGLIDGKVIAGVILAWLLQLLIKHFPKGLRFLVLRIAVKRMKKIKNLRRSQSQVTYYTMKAHAFFLFFIGSFCFFFILVFNGPLLPIFEAPLLFLLLFSPVLVIELFWLYHDHFAKSLIKQFDRLAKQ